MNHRVSQFTFGANSARNSSNELMTFGKIEFNASHLKKSTITVTDTVLSACEQANLKLGNIYANVWCRVPPERTRVQVKY